MFYNLFFILIIYYLINFVTKLAGNEQTRDLMNYIYYNEDIEHILKHTDSSSEQQITAEYFIDSLVNQIFYVCGPVAGTAAWKDFPTLCRNKPNRIYNYFPGIKQINLYIYFYYHHNYYYYIR